MLIRAVGWRASFAILGFSVLAIGLPCGFRIRERPRASHILAAPVTGAAVREGVRSRIFWIIVAGLFLISITRTA